MGGMVLRKFPPVSSMPKMVEAYLVSSGSTTVTNSYAAQSNQVWDFKQNAFGCTSSASRSGLDQGIVIGEAGLYLLYMRLGFTNASGNMGVAPIVGGTINAQYRMQGGTTSVSAYTTGAYISVTAGTVVGMAYYTSVASKIMAVGDAANCCRIFIVKVG